MVLGNFASIFLIVFFGENNFDESMVSKKLTPISTAALNLRGWPA
jgi:hypothetical protein